MQNLKQNLIGVLAKQLTTVNISNLDATDLFNVIEHGIEYLDSSTFSEVVELKSIDEATSRSIKYVIKFNLGNLFEYLASTVITIAGAITMPWVIILGLLILVKQLYSASQVEVDENSAKVLWTMCLLNSGTHKEYSGRLNFDNIYKFLNIELVKQGYYSLSRREVEESLEKLEGLFIVEKIGDEWEIIETIQVNKVEMDGRGQPETKLESEVSEPNSERGQELPV